MKIEIGIKSGSQICRPACYTTGMARKLRIAVSVFFGLATVALCVLWVRSYWLNEMVSRSGGNSFIAVGSNAGCFYFVQMSATPAPGGAIYWVFDQTAASIVPADFYYLKPKNSSNILRLPHRYLVLTFATLTTIPWVSKRFGLRSLMLTTTLVAVVLGLGAWMAS